MLKILNNREFDKIAIIFDSGVKNFRHDIYSEYKANRVTVPLDLINQLTLVDDVAKILSIPSFKVIGFEADDIIASIAVKAYSEGFSVEIVSSDKDLMQLVNDRIYLFDPSKDKVFMCEDVKEKFGVPPKMLTDLLTLTGDASDNIPGVHGIGPKTAAKLINQFGSIDSIISNADKILNAKQRESILGSVDKILISRDLVTLCLDVPIKVNIDDL
uniref:5'-3' exonuclease domain-containing protein n=1 Tax=Biomphalaria glabrata TaxID=6526 RepID=A0A2C9KR80_BIOGL